MKKVLAFMIVTVIVIILIYSYIKGTPQYSLYRFREAVKSHDVDAAFKYLDVNTIVDNLANDILKAEAKELRNSAKYDRQDLTKATRMMMMLPSIKETVKGQIVVAITTSSDKYPADDKTPIKHLYEGGLSDFEIKVDGKMATISRKSDTEVQFKMLKTRNGHWKIIQLMIPL